MATQEHIQNARAPVVPFMTTRDQGNLMPGDDDAPGMLINPEATAGTLFAIAQSRLENLQSLLDSMSHEVDSEAARLVDSLQPYLQEVGTLLDEGNNRLHHGRQGKEVAHG